MSQDIGQLSEDEKQLLAYYRAANAIGKDRIMDNAFLGAYTHHGPEQVQRDRPTRRGHQSATDMDTTDMDTMEMDTMEMDTDTTDTTDTRKATETSTRPMDTEDTDHEAAKAAPPTPGPPRDGATRPKHPHRPEGRAVNQTDSKIIQDVNQNRKKDC